MCTWQVAKEVYIPWACRLGLMCLYSSYLLSYLLTEDMMALLYCFLLFYFRCPCLFNSFIRGNLEDLQIPSNSLLFFCVCVRIVENTSNLENDNSYHLKHCYACTVYFCVSPPSFYVLVIVQLIV